MQNPTYDKHNLDNHHKWPQGVHSLCIRFTGKDSLSTLLFSIFHSDCCIGCPSLKVLDDNDLLWEGIFEVRTGDRKVRVGTLTQLLMPIDLMALSLGWGRGGVNVTVPCCNILCNSNRLVTHPPILSWTLSTKGYQEHTQKFFNSSCHYKEGWGWEICTTGTVKIAYSAITTSPFSFCSFTPSVVYSTNFTGQSRRTSWIRKNSQPQCPSYIEPALSNIAEGEEPCLYEEKWRAWSREI